MQYCQIRKTIADKDLPRNEFSHCLLFHHMLDTPIIACTYQVETHLTLGKTSKRPTHLFSLPYCTAYQPVIGLMGSLALSIPILYCYWGKLSIRETISLASFAFLLDILPHSSCYIIFQPYWDIWLGPWGFRTDGLLATFFM